MSGNSTETKVLFKTNMGDITIQLYSDMPITAGNFEKLVKEDFYNGIVFHRIIDGFMIQGGDPKGDGTGGPGYNIQDEFTQDNRNSRGTLSMANSNSAATSRCRHHRPKWKTAWRTTAPSCRFPVATYSFRPGIRAVFQLLISRTLPTRQRLLISTVVQSMQKTLF